MTEFKNNFDSHSNTIGGRISLVRDRSGLSQQEFAKKLGYESPGAISRIEKDLSPPSIPSIVLLAKIFNVDLHWILTGRPSPGAMVAAKNYIKLSERIAHYVGYQLGKILERKTRLNDNIEQVTDTVARADLQARMKDCEEQYNQIIKDLALLKESPFGGDSYEEVPTPIEKIVMPKPE